METKGRRGISSEARAKPKQKVPMLSLLCRKQATYELDLCVKTDPETGEVTFDLGRLKL